jgi:hypothetical protein
MGVNLYAVVGQAWIADLIGTTDSTRRMVPGANNINITGAGTLTITTASGTTASAASDVAAVTASPVACGAGADTVITVVGTGNIIVTVTYASTANWSSHYTWATSSGGAPNSNAAEPTNADNVYMDANSFTAGSQVLTVDATSFCLDVIWTGATFTPTLAGSAALHVAGSITFIGAMVSSYSGLLWCDGNNNINLTTNGLSLVNFFMLYFANNARTLTLQDNLTTTENFDTQFGTFISNNKTLTAMRYYAAYGGGVTTTLGSSIINVTSWTASNGTLTPNTSTINCSGNFSGGGLTTYNVVNLTGATSTVTGNNTIKTVGLTKAGVQTITATGTTQTVTNFVRDGGATVKTIVNGTFVKVGNSPVVDLDFMSISGSTATPSQTWFAGTHSTDGGTNTGWVFSNAPHRGWMP